MSKVTRTIFIVTLFVIKYEVQEIVLFSILFVSEVNLNLVRLVISFVHINFDVTGC